MREEITDYKTVEESATRIRCDICETTWESRDDDGLNHLVLDCRVEERSYDEWKEKDRWGSRRSLSTIKDSRLSGKAEADYCDACLSSFFTAGHAVEVEEAEYRVEEETRDKYYCDFCGDCMGEGVEHTVSVNPRIKVLKRHRSNQVLDTSKEVVHVCRGLDEASPSFARDSKKYAERDECYDCCESCANEMFEWSESYEHPPIERLSRWLLGLRFGIRKI